MVEVAAAINNIHYINTPMLSLRKLNVFQKLPSFEQHEQQVQ